MSHDRATDKSKSIGWYSLALLVSRKEKERAIGVYKLLAYSFEDRAYALQVEADLLWAFDDARAIEKYMQAAEIYQEGNYKLSALGVYEHLCLLENKVFDHHANVSVLAAQLMRYDKLKHYFEYCIDLYQQQCARDDQMHALAKQILAHIASHPHCQKKQWFENFIAQRFGLSKS